MTECTLSTTIPRQHSGKTPEPKGELRETSIETNTHGVTVVIYMLYIVLYILYEFSKWAEQLLI